VVARGREEAGEAEVGEAGVEVAVEEDVGGLEVAVDDGAVVQVLEPLGVAVSDPHPRPPWQERVVPAQQQVVL